MKTYSWRNNLTEATRENDKKKCAAATIYLQSYICTFYYYAESICENNKATAAVDE